jgi:hypothetical protein
MKNMNKAKLFLVVACGCVTSLIVGRAIVDVGAQGESQGANIQVCVDKNDVMRVVASSSACPNGQRSLILKNALSDLEPEKPENKTPDKTPNPSLDQAKLKDLNVRLIKLEEMGCAALRKNKVVAPFEVVDSSGKTIFSVIENAVGLFKGGEGSPVAAFIASEKGAFFSAKGGDMRVSFGIIDPLIAGVNVSEGGKSRITLGKSLEKGNYRVAFTSSSNIPVAGLGESPSNGAGLVLINDGQGNQKAIMEVGDDGKGRIGIMSGGRRPIAALTEGESRAGVFYACAAGGSCDPVMVSAGTNESGVGVVATGPVFYVQGPTGAPGSFLIGKK